MSESKHTPGPWEVARSRRSGLIGVSAKAMDPMALVCTMTDGVCDNCDANARLIAACPDLLAVVRRVVEIADATNEAGDLAQQARAAIAKATGGPA